MQIHPKTHEESFELVVEILNQGDIRYNSPENELVLADAIIKNAISLEEREIPIIHEPTANELIKAQPQAHAKYLAKDIPKQENFKDSEIFFEKPFLGSRVDVFAKSESKIIAVECYSCRVDKVIEYLFEVDEVWIFTRGELPYEKLHYQEEKAQWFVFTKGENWNLVEKFQQNQQEQIKKVKSPLDLMDIH